jgi:GMP synthase-like glutamine amidotransferase
MRIAIIETGAPPEALRDRHPHYPDMMRRAIGPNDPRLSFSAHRVFEGAAPPPVGMFDGFLFTGSSAGVYEGHDWIAPTEALIREAAAAGKPQVGICFGHQLMAQAFGGKVEKSEKGWGVGLHAYDVVDEADWMAPRPRRIACAVSHQDQVVVRPAGSRRLIGSAFCENAALAYAQGPAISFQMHPEFEHDYAADLIRLRRGRLGDEVASAGLSSLSQRSDRELIARWIAAFFGAHR